MSSFEDCAVPAGCDLEIRPIGGAVQQSTPEATPGVPYYVRALALGIPAYLLGIHLWTWVLYLPLFLSGHADFRQLYVGGYMLRAGYAHELYDYGAQKEFQNRLVSAADVALPVNHLAYEELLFLPFSYFRYPSAYFLFLVLNLVLLSTVYQVMRPWTRRLAAIYKWLPGAMFLAFLPIAAALIQGQDSILLLLLFASACGLLQSERHVAAGALLGLALFKFQLILPIVVLFLLWRRWRFVAGFFLAGTVVLASSVSLVGWQQIRIYVQSLMYMSVGLSSVSEQVKYGIYPAAMPNIRGLIFGLTNPHLSPTVTFAATVISSCAVLALVTKSGMHLCSDLDRMLLAVTATILVSYHMLIHDLSIMLVPIFVILSRFLAAEGRGKRLERMLARSAVLAFVAPISFSYVPEQFFIVSTAVGFFLSILLIQSQRNGSLDGIRTLSTLHLPRVSA
jgi:hypothetical protein